MIHARCAFFGIPDTGKESRQSENQLPIMVAADGARVIVPIIAKQRYVFALRHAGNTVFAELSILNT